MLCSILSQLTSNDSDICERIYYLLEYLRIIEVVSLVIKDEIPVNLLL